MMDLQNNNPTKLAEELEEIENLVLEEKNSEFIETQIQPLSSQNQKRNYLKILFEIVRNTSGMAYIIMSLSLGLKSSSSENIKLAGCGQPRASQMVVVSKPEVSKTKSRLKTQ